MDNSSTDPNEEIEISLDDVTLVNENSGEQFDGEDRRRLSETIERPLLWSITPGLDPDFESELLLHLGCESRLIRPGQQTLQHLWKEALEWSPPDAIKLSDRFSPADSTWLYEQLSVEDVFIVLVSSEGEEIEDDHRMALHYLLLPAASLFVTDRAGLGAVSGQPVGTPSDVLDAAKGLLQSGCESVYVVDPASGNDCWAHGSQSVWLKLPALPSPSSRFNRELLGAAAMAYHSLGYHDLDAAILARTVLQQNLHDAKDRDEGEPTSPSRACRRTDLVPELLESDDKPRIEEAFPRPSAPTEEFHSAMSAVEAERLIREGSRALWLHLPHDTSSANQKELQTLRTPTRSEPVELMVVSDWKLALEESVQGVVLTQAEALSADLPALQSSGLQLTIRVRSYTDLAFALSCRPSTICIGPVYGEPEQATPPPLGFDTFRHMCSLVDLPVYAFGNISHPHIPDLKNAGASGWILGSG